MKVIIDSGEVRLRLGSGGGSLLRLRGLLGRDRGGSLGLLVILLLLRRSIGRGGSGATLGTTLGRRPESEVVPEKLHNEGRITVRFLRKRVELGNGVIKRLLGKVASAIRRVKDLVVKDREVERKAETDGVGGRELSLGNIGGVLGGCQSWLWEGFGSKSE